MQLTWTKIAHLTLMFSNIKEWNWTKGQLQTQNIVNMVYELRVDAIEQINETGSFSYSPTHGNFAGHLILS